MLVLYRKVGEGVVINEDITITVVAIRNGKVRLEIVAPARTTVHQQEVIEAIDDRYNRLANQRVQACPVEETPFELLEVLPNGIVDSRREEKNIRFTAEGGIARKENRGKSSEKRGSG